MLTLLEQFCSHIEFIFTKEGAWCFTREFFQFIVEFRVTDKQLLTDGIYTEILILEVFLHECIHLVEEVAVLFRESGFVAEVILLASG